MRLRKCISHALQRVCIVACSLVAILSLCLSASSRWCEIRFDIYSPKSRIVFSSLHGLLFCKFHPNEHELGRFLLKKRISNRESNWCFLDIQHLYSSTNFGVVYETPLKTNVGYFVRVGNQLKLRDDPGRSTVKTVFLIFPLGLLALISGTWPAITACGTLRNRRFNASVPQRPPDECIKGA